MYDYLFEVAAITPEGHNVQVSRSAPDKVQLIDLLHAEGLLLICCRKKQAWKTYFLRLGWQHCRESVRLQFSNGLYNTVKSGIPLLEAINIISHSQNRFLQAACERVKESLFAGNSLHDALKKTGMFERTHLAIIRAGENSGTLESSLWRLRKMLQEKQIYKNKMTAALVYPIITALVSMLCIYIISTYVLPQIISITSRADTESASGLMLLSAIGHYVPLMFFFMFAFIFFSSLFLKKHFNKYSRQISWLLINIPIAGTLMKLCDTAVFARLVSILLQSGMRIDFAFAMAADSCMLQLFKEQAAGIADMLLKGMSLDQAMSAFNGFFPDIMIEACVTGMRTGNLPEALSFAVECIETDIDVQKSLIASLVQPAFIILTGLFIAYFSYTVFAHIYGILGEL